MSDGVALLRQVMPAVLPRLRRFARALTHHPSAADDLAQATIERALARAARHAPPQGASAAQIEAAVRNWMFGIMKNTWIDARRAARRKRGRFASGEDASAAAGQAHLAQEQRSSIQAAMGRLPGEQQLAVALVLVEGLSYGEAAEVIGIAVDTLTSRLSRGREALAGLLQESAEAR